MFGFYMNVYFKRSAGRAAAVEFAEYALQFRYAEADESAVYEAMEADRALRVAPATKLEMNALATGRAVAALPYVEGVLVVRTGIVGFLDATYYGKSDETMETRDRAFTELGEEQMEALQRALLGKSTIRVD